jgi:hypothetical protein
MQWKKFALFNVLEAATWVTAIALIGYEFANQFQTLLDLFGKVSWAMADGLFVIGYLLWRRQKNASRNARTAKIERQPSSSPVNSLCWQLLQQMSGSAVRLD